MKQLILITFLSLFAGFSSAHDDDTLLRYDQPSKTVYYGKLSMSYDNLFVIMRPYEESFGLIQSAKNSNFWSKLFLNVGLVPVAATVFYYLPTNDFRWIPFTIGAGLVGISIPFHFSSLKKTRLAVDSFNNRKNQTFQNHPKLNLSLGMTTSGVGLQIHF